MATKRNAEEVQRLLEEYRQSCEKRTAFCRRQGIPVTTLDYYLRRQALQARPRLARVKLAAQSSDPTAFTPEWQAREDARDGNLRRSMGNICRGC